MLIAMGQCPQQFRALLVSEEKRKVLLSQTRSGGFLMVNIMKVAIEVNGEVIWYRDSDKQEGWRRWAT